MPPRQGKRIPPKSRSPRKQPLIWHELALLVMLQIAWIARLAFVIFLVWQLSRGRFLAGTGYVWKVIFLVSYFALTGIGLLYVRADRPTGAAWRESRGRLAGMGFRIVLHGLTISLIALELAWDLGHQSLVSGFLQSLWAGATWAALACFFALLVAKATRAERPR